LEQKRLVFPAARGHLERLFFALFTENRMAVGWIFQPLGQAHGPTVEK
jgi:hypothetical protein